jgi:hypothetical protein
VITHDEGIAASLPRRIALLDGRVERDTGSPAAEPAGAERPRVEAGS